MMEALFIIFGLIGVMAFLFIIATYNKNKTKNLSEVLPIDTYTRIPIEFTRLRQSRFTMVGGITINAELVFNDELLIIQASKNNNFGNLAYPLPIILSSTHSEILQKQGYYNILHPHTIKFSELGSLIVLAEETTIGKLKYEIQITAKNKEDKAKLAQLKDHALYKRCNA